MSLVCGFCWCFREGQWSFERFLFSQLVVARMFLKLFYLHLLLQGKGFQSTGSFTLRRLAFFFSFETILFHAKSDIIGLCEHVFASVASVVCSHESHHVQFEYLSKEVLCLAFANTNKHLVC